MDLWPTNAMSLRFRLIDLLTVVTLLCIFFALGLPYLAKQRIQSRNMQCQTQLRVLGSVAHQFAEVDRQHRLCSGGFDSVNDGSPDTVGWIHDAISQGVRPGKMLCPANPVQSLETINGWIDAEIFANSNADAVSQAVNAGYNSNYSQSWFYARGTVRWAAFNGQGYIAGDQRTLAGGLSGLRRKFVDRGRTFASLIPLLGDAAPNPDAKSNALKTAVGPLHPGSTLGQAYGNGPSWLNETQRRLVLLSTVSSAPTGTPLPDCIRGDSLPQPSSTSDGGLDLDDDGELEPLTAANYGGKDGRLFLQDTRNFAAVHGGKCNVLFADGSVRAICDTNGDGILNPGFVFHPGDLSEIATGLMYSGPLLNWADYFKSCDWFDGPPPNRRGFPAEPPPK